MNILNRRTQERLHKLTLKVLARAPLSPEEAATLTRRGLMTTEASSYGWQLTAKGQKLSKG